MNGMSSGGSTDNAGGLRRADGAGDGDRSFWQGMLGLILPRGCAGCDKPDEVLCGECRALFSRHTDVPFNGLPDGVPSMPADMPGSMSGALNGKVSAASRQPAHTMIHVAGAYQGNARRAILSWKDRGDVECDRAFSQVCRELVADSGLIDILLEEQARQTDRLECAGRTVRTDSVERMSQPRLAWQAHYPRQTMLSGLSGFSGRIGILEHARFTRWAGVPNQTGLAKHHTSGHAQVLVVPAPSSPKSMRVRGRSHLWPLAKATAAELAAAGVDACAVNALGVRHVQGKAVETRNAPGRAARLDGQLEVAYPGLVAGRSVLILDDIVTTGTTMRRCAEAIRGARGRVVGGLALAAVPSPSKL